MAKHAERAARMMIALLLVGACGSAVVDEQFARELVDRGAPAAAYRGTGEEVLVTQRTVDAVREAVQDTADLVAFLQLPQGIHPYLTVAFVEREEDVVLLMTSVYWGRIQGKWEDTVEPETAGSLIQLASETFDCRPGRIPDFLYGAALIHWPNEEQVMCDGGWMGEQAAPFVERFQPILDRAVATYEPP